MPASEATPNNHQLETVTRLLLMLEQGTADRVFVAAQLARSSASLPQLRPLVLQLAHSFDAAERAEVLAVLPASVSPAPDPHPAAPTSATPTPVAAAPAPSAHRPAAAGSTPPPAELPSPREQARGIWQQVGDPYRALLLIAPLVCHDPTLAEDARRLAAKLPQARERQHILALVKRALPVVPEVPVVEQMARHSPAVAGVRVDPEIGRLALALGHAALHRIWSIGRHHAAANGGKTAREALVAQLAALGIRYNTRYFRQLLRQGDGLFWGLGRDGTVYFRSGERVGAALVRQAKHQGRADLYETNLPGGRDVWVTIQTGDLADYEAMLYAAWLAWRNSPTIARATLARLFGRCADTLRNWEERLGGQLEVKRNDAQSTCADPAQRPPHATQYLTWNNDIRYRWQVANSYRAALRVHAHKGQARKRREAAGRAAFGQPVDAHQAHPRGQRGSKRHQSCWWFDRTHRTKRRYHGKPGKLLGMVKRDAQAKYPTGIGRQEHYVWRGIDGQGKGSYEYVPREAPTYEIDPNWQPQTRAGERVPLRVEYALRGEAKRAERQYLTFLRAQGELA